MRKENILSGRVVEIETEKRVTRLKVDFGGEEFITVIVTEAAWKELGARVGDELEVFTDKGFMAERILH